MDPKARLSGGSEAQELLWAICTRLHLLCHLPHPALGTASHAAAGALFSASGANHPPTTGLAINVMPSGYVPLLASNRSLVAKFVGVSLIQLTRELMNLSRVEVEAMAAAQSSQSPVKVSQPLRLISKCLSFSCALQVRKSMAGEARRTFRVHMSCVKRHTII